MLVTTFRLLVTVILPLRVRAELKPNVVYLRQNFSHLLPSLLIDVPPGCEGITSSCPVAIMIPPEGGGDSYYLASPAYTTCRSHGFICAYFDSEVAEWSVVYISSLYSILQEAGAVGNVYLLGRSHGGWYAHNAITATSLPVAGMATTGTPMMFNKKNLTYRSFPHVNTPKIAVLSIRGQADHIIPIKGGACGEGYSKQKELLGVTGMDEDLWSLSQYRSSEWWKHHNGCTGSLSNASISASYAPKYEEATTGVVVDSTADHLVWEGCPDFARVEYVLIHDADHGEEISLDGRPYEDFAFDFFDDIEQRRRQMARGHDEAALEAFFAKAGVATNCSLHVGCHL